MSKLIIAEKPSVAFAISKALGITDKRDGFIQGKDYIVSWCFGHLVTLADAIAYDEKYGKWRHEDLPILPDEWQYTVSDDKKTQFNIICSLMNRADIDSLVCATDAGREGELIFRLVYLMANCTKPFERLWISSMEDEAIRDGFNKLRPGAEYANLYASALCRSKADWLVGINATRLFTTLYYSRLNVGRVQSPTLAMLVERDAQIKGFKKAKYYHVHIAHVTWGDGMEATGERIMSKVEAESIRDACHHKQALVMSVKQEQKTVNPPKLYDLTTLQREANRMFGYTAQQTLDSLQSLYEKKLTTYPRTDSRFLTEDMRETASSIVSGLQRKHGFELSLSYEPDIERVINNDKVSDHHAIIPTLNSLNTDYSALPEAERTILALIGTRLLCAVAEKHLYETVTAELDCEGNTFTAKGKTIVQDGWKELERRFKDSMKNKTVEDEETDEDKTLPRLYEGQRFESVDASVTEHTTTPPKPYTEDTLLSAMETAGNEDIDEDTEKKGIGTPATRASIIEKLVNYKYAERKGKQLLPTQTGINLISILPERVKSPSLTAEWENTLTKIAKGQQSPDDFMENIVVFTKEIISSAKTSTRADNNALFQPQKEVIGPCPRCGGNVVEGKQNFYCSNKECRFCMWKDDKFFTSKKKKLTKTMAAALLKKGRVSVKGLYFEKSGRKCDAVVVLKDTGEKYVNYGLEIDKKSV